MTQIKKRKPCSEETKRKIGLANSKPKTKKSCKVCGNSFIVKFGRRNTAKYCSNPCQRKDCFSNIPWNKGTKGICKAWNKGKKCPQFSGKNHPMWKGGRYISQNGYIFVWSPNHPLRNKDGYVLEHRLVMEQKIGRFLKSKEVVHHVDNNSSNNISTNLMLFKTDSDHHKYHHEQNRFKKWLKTGILDGKSFARYSLLPKGVMKLDLF